VQFFCDRVQQDLDSSDAKVTCVLSRNIKKALHQQSKRAKNVEGSQGKTRRTKCGRVRNDE
jgi:hypothetical protein